jgi:hypothetical protein
MRLPNLLSKTKCSWLTYNSLPEPEDQEALDRLRKDKDLEALLAWLRNQRNLRLGQIISTQVAEQMQVLATEARIFDFIGKFLESTED